MTYDDKGGRTKAEPKENVETPTLEGSAMDSAVREQDGKLVVDMAKADELWNSLDPMKRAEMTNLIFEPILQNATTMRYALEAIIEKCGENGSRPEIEAIARDALPK